MRQWPSNITPSSSTTTGDSRSPKTRALPVSSTRSLACTLPTSSPFTTSVPARTLALTTPRSPMMRVSGEAISPWNFPLRRTVPVNVYLPSISEPSSRKAVSFLRVTTVTRGFRGHMLRSIPLLERAPAGVVDPGVAAGARLRAVASEHRTWPPGQVCCARTNFHYATSLPGGEETELADLIGLTLSQMDSMSARWTLHDEVTVTELTVGPKARTGLTAGRSAWAGRREPEGSRSHLPA